MFGHPVNRVLDPKAEKHVDGAVAESHQMTNRPWRSEHTIGPPCNLDGKIARHVQVTAVSHAELHIEPDKEAGIGPVDHLVGDQVFVRDQVFLAVPAAHRCVACAEITDRAEGAADFDHVSRLYRAPEQQDDAADKIRYDFLQTEPDADTDGPLTPRMRSGRCRRR